jgi:hypothetical protein
MSRLRAFFVWLVMAALPLQGIAAVSMLYCKGHAAGAAQSQAHHPHAADAGAAHDHSKHSHARAESVKPSGDAPAGLPDIAHKCGICASCCHPLETGGFAGWPRFAPLPQAQTTEPFVPIHAATLPLPDKPPRA